MNAMTVAIIASLFATQVQAPQCRSSSAPALDHVVLVTRDLDRASARLRSHGFRLKHGRLHSNNLLNRHIKFRDGTSIELMALAGKPNDAMSRRYAELIQAGDGGVYVALNAANIDATERMATELKIASHRSASGPLRFLGFPATSPAAAVFFSSGGSRPNDPDSLLSHVPAVTGLSEVWVEGGAPLIALLKKLGAKRCGAALSHDGRRGERVGLSGGSLVVVPARPRVRPRVIGAVVRSEAQFDKWVDLHPGFWLHYRLR